MGSPFPVADVDLKGIFVPSFEGHTFQDKGILNNRRDICYLVEWKTFARGKPGFCVWKISEHERAIKKSKIIEGCCDGIELYSNGIELTILRGTKKEKLYLEDFS